VDDSSSVLEHIFVVYDNTKESIEVSLLSGYELILRWIFLPHAVASIDAFIILDVHSEPSSVA
jgi:hypothetical protein